MGEATTMSGRSARAERAERWRAQLRFRLWHAAVVGWLLALAMIAGISGAGEERQLLPDTDDTMRAVQVLRWIDGAGWRDLSEPRLSPPEGVITHWARLPDMPIAAVVLAAEPIVGRKGALVAAAYVVPAGLLLAAMAAVAWAAVPFGAATARAAPVLAAFCPPFLAKFFPGALDHHNWQLILSALLVGAVLRICASDRPLSAFAVTGLAGAAGLWIGGEMLPWIAVAYGALAFCWCADPRWPARRGLSAATAITVVAVPLLWLVMPPGLGAGHCDAFSPAYAAYAAAGIPFWLMLACVEGRVGGVAGRVAATVAAALAVVAVFMLFFPECRAGPLGAIPPELREAWLARVSEARGFASVVARTPGIAVQLALLPVLGLICCAVRGASRRADAPLWRVQAFFLLIAVGLCFSQVRLLPFANLFALTPAVWLLLWLWGRLAGHPVGGRAVARAMLLLAFTPIPYAMALPKGAPVKAPRICDARAVGDALAGGDARNAPLIAAPIDMGPALLLRTPASVLAAPYHRNVDGNMDLIGIMRAQVDNARDIVRRRGVDFMAVCTSLAEIDGYAATNPQGLAARLSAGDPPPWLAPVPTPGDAALRLYRILPD